MFLRFLLFTNYKFYTNVSLYKNDHIEPSSCSVFAGTWPNNGQTDRYRD